MSTFDISYRVRPTFLVCAPVWVDYQLELDGSPKPGQASRILREERTFGGRGAITAALLATWGADAILASPDVGEDSNGRFVRRELEIVPNLTVSLLANSTGETPYRVLLASESSASCEMWRGHGSRIGALNDVMTASVTFLVLDDETLECSPSQRELSSYGTPHFACVVSAQSTLARGARMVWVRHETLEDDDLRAVATELDTTAIILSGSSLRLSASGAQVQTIQLARSPRAGQFEIGSSESVWASLIWGDANGWPLEDSLFFARAVIEVRSQSRNVMPSLDAISEAARGMLK